MMDDDQERLSCSFVYTAETLDDYLHICCIPLITQHLSEWTTIRIINQVKNRRMAERDGERRLGKVQNFK